MSNQSILRITRELGEIQKASDLSLAVSCCDANVRQIRAMVIGPPETPYEFGFFEFQVKFGADYPNTPPQVQALTTNGGRTRFNPNIYSSGKVCLSILGTWRGTSGEEWSSAQSLESILISIQSLMSANPYENEPGFEDCRGDSEKKDQTEYAAKICHESLRISVIERMEGILRINGTNQTRPSSGKKTLSEVSDDDEDSNVPPYAPFKDICKRRFLWHYDSYLLTIETEHAKHDDEEKFARMPFEGGGNIMEGKFNYTQLKTRLVAIKAALETEAQKWVSDGVRAREEEFVIAAHLERQYITTKDLMKEQERNIDIELVDGNPFHWQVLIFGQPMSNLDGGIFRFFIRISTKFPEEQPRVLMETPIFHHRVAKDGIVCYMAPKPEEMKSHIMAIMDTIEEETPAYDPRKMVNPEATKLFWGSPEDKKQYNRRLRRSVQDSAENF